MRHAAAAEWATGHTEAAAPPVISTLLYRWRRASRCWAQEAAEMFVKVVKGIVLEVAQRAALLGLSGGSGARRVAALVPRPASSRASTQVEA